MPKGHGINTGPTLRDWLITNGRGSPYDFYMYMKNNPVLVDRGYKIGGWQSVRTMFYLLKSKLYLIDVVEHKMTEQNRRRSLYAIIPGYQRDMAWTDIYKYSYPLKYKNNGTQIEYWEIRKRLGMKSVTPQVFKKESGK